MLCMLLATSTRTQKISRRRVNPTRSVRIGERSENSVQVLGHAAAGLGSRTVQSAPRGWSHSQQVGLPAGWFAAGSAPGTSSDWGGIHDGRRIAAARHRSKSPSHPTSSRLDRASPGSRATASQRLAGGRTTRTSANLACRSTRASQGSAGPIPIPQVTTGQSRPRQIVQIGPVISTRHGAQLGIWPPDGSSFRQAETAPDSIVSSRCVAVWPVASVMCWISKEWFFRHFAPATPSPSGESGTEADQRSSMMNRTFRPVVSAGPER